MGYDYTPRAGAIASAESSAAGSAAAAAASAATAAAAAASASATPSAAAAFFRVRFGRLAFAQRQITPTASWPHRGGSQRREPQKKFSKKSKK